MSEHDSTDASPEVIDPRFRRRDKHGRPVMPFIEQDGKSTRLFIDPLRATPEEQQQAIHHSLELYFACLLREWNDLRAYSNLHCLSSGEDLPLAFHDTFPTDAVLQLSWDPRTVTSPRVPDGYRIEILDISEPDARGRVAYTFKLVSQGDTDA